MQPHLCARQGHAARWTSRNGDALAVVVDGDRRLVAVLDGPDDVRRPERSVAAEEHTGPGRHERRLIDDGHVPLAELQADVPFDERKRIVLPDGENDGVARDDLAADDFLFQPGGRFDGFELVELHSGQRAALDDEAHRLQVFENLDVLFFRVFELPG